MATKNKSRSGHLERSFLLMTILLDRVDLYQICRVSGGATGQSKVRVTKTVVGLV